MKIAILGASSEIAKDLILMFLAGMRTKLYLFSRNPSYLKQWLGELTFPHDCHVGDFNEFGLDDYDAVINFVGVGNPAKAIDIGPAIFDITYKYDQLALNYVLGRSNCRYIFISSGAAYLSKFEFPVDVDTQITINLNEINSQDWYGLAKFHAECRHRALKPLPIVDIRIFNYFSYTQDINARFLIADIIRSIKQGKLLETSPHNIERDYIGAADFYQLVCAILSSPPVNLAVDCYSRATIDKRSLLDLMSTKFGLQFAHVTKLSEINATNIKYRYYSLNRSANYFGYKPSLSSIELIEREARRYLSINI